MIDIKEVRAKLSELRSTVPDPMPVVKTSKDLGLHIDQGVSLLFNEVFTKGKGRNIALYIERILKLYAQPDIKESTKTAFDTMVQLCLAQGFQEIMTEYISKLNTLKKEAPEDKIKEGALEKYNGLLYDLTHELLSELDAWSCFIYTYFESSTDIMVS